MALFLSPVIKDEKITLLGWTNIILFTTVGFMGVFMGLFFSIPFFIKARPFPLALNISMFFLGIMSLIFLYWYTGRMEDGSE